MASGPERLVPDPRYAEEFGRARDLLLDHPGRWRVVYHYDGDGIASASSALRALGRLGYAAQATPLVGVERERMAEILRATPGPLLLVDTGASWLDLYGRHPAPVVVLDHHRYPAPSGPPARSVALVNPLDWGVDGMSELCAATLTWLFTVFLDPRNWDNAPWGLSGAIADRQHVGGFRGLNAALVDEAIRRSSVVVRPGLAVFGPTIADALVRSIDPYVVGLSGRPDPVRSLLAELGIPADRAPSELTVDERERLAEALKRRLRAHGVRPEFLGVVDQPRYHLPSLGMDAEELSNLQNATGRIGRPDLGLALALGDPAAVGRAREAESTWRHGILKGIRRVEDGEVHGMAALQWFESPEATLAGTQAGLAMNYVVDPERPLFSFSPGDGPIKVSARGTARLVERGLDLAETCRTAATSVGGEGGGHRVASGATIPAGSRERFLEIADRLTRAQLGRAGAA